MGRVASHASHLRMTGMAWPTAGTSALERIPQQRVLRLDAVEAEGEFDHALGGRDDFGGGRREGLQERGDRRYRRSRSGRSHPSDRCSWSRRRRPGDPRRRSDRRNWGDRCSRGLEDFGEHVQHGFEPDRNGGLGRDVHGLWLHGLRLQGLAAAWSGPARAETRAAWPRATSRMRRSRSRQPRRRPRHSQGRAMSGPRAWLPGCFRGMRVRNGSGASVRSRTFRRDVPAAVRRERTSVLQARGFQPRCGDES